MQKISFSIPTMAVISALFCLIIAPGCGIQVKEANLYDGKEVPLKPIRPSKLSLAVEPLIFDEDGTNFWTPQDSDCTIGEVTSESTQQGEVALKINWNRDPSKCEWAGFGIGWDDWAGKDLTDVFDYAAIEMHVRTQEGKMFGLPAVLTLEDYSGHMAWSYTANRYFEKYYIDEEWQQVLIPLNSFDLDEDGLDIGNIKQLMFELQSAGAIYLDNIRLVYAEPRPVESWMAEPALPTLSYPIQLFDDGFINNSGWGFYTDQCQKIELVSSTKSEGQKSIHATWDKEIEDCYLVAIGGSWNNWSPVDISNDNVVIELDVKVSKKVDSGTIRVGFEDYERRTSFVDVSTSRIGPNWTTLKLPVKDAVGNVDLTDIKQFMIRMEGAGEVFIDNIRLVSDK